MTFEQRWKWAESRGSLENIQDYKELEYIYHLISGCESYLEIGSAEGNSLYILAGSLKPNSKITYVDWNESHTREARLQSINELSKEGFKTHNVHGDTRDLRSIEWAKGKYEVVLIDAGHSYEDVIQDARNYGPMATKYLLFHDINLPEVKQAFQEYQKETGLLAYTISNSNTFGFGIMEIK